MKVPDSIADRALLKYEPFLSSFEKRRLATSDGFRGKTRSKVASALAFSISREEFESYNALQAAQAWIAMAFPPSTDGKGVTTSRIEEAGDPLAVFVEYYWQLSKDEGDAELYLLRERGRRGFNDSFVLKATSQRRNAVSPKKRGRRSGGKRARFCQSSQDGVDGYDAEGENEVTSEHNLELAEAQVAPSSMSACAQHTSESEAADIITEVKSSRRSKTSRSGQASIKKRKVALNSSSKDDAAPADASLNCDMVVDPDPTATTSPITTPGNMQPANDAPSITSHRRIQPTRQAAHTERLSHMMAVETASQTKFKRGQMEGSDDDEDTSLLATTSHAKAKVKSSKPPKADQEQVPQPQTPGAHHAQGTIVTSGNGTMEDPNTIGSQTLVAGIGFPSEVTLTSISSQKVSPRPKKTAKKPLIIIGQRRTTNKLQVGRRRKPARDLEPQAAKRRRQNDGTSLPVEPTGITADVMPIEQNSPATDNPRTIEPLLSTTKKPTQTHLGAPARQTASVAPESVSTLNVPSAEMNNGRKRRRSATETAEILPSATDQSGDACRPSKALPKKGGKTKTTALPVTKGVLRSNVPRTLVEVDSVICHSVPAESISSTNATPHESPASDWEHDDDSSDDDTPLAVKLNVNRARASTGRSSETVAAAPTEHEAVAPPFEDETLHDPISVPAPAAHPKPALPGYPPIWSQSRQEVCESFDLFRSYQGGVYFVNDMAKGYLLSAFSASRDIFHHRGKLIVSHGGGRGAESLHHRGPDAIQASDQLADDKSVRALLKTMELKRPLALIIDDKYTLFPFDLASRECTYAVLGFYRIAHAWAEKQSAPSNEEQVVRYKFAFQWCEEQGDPWWWSESNSGPGAGPLILNNIPSRNPRATIRPLSVGAGHPTCRSCGGSSPRVYTEGWMCLKPACPKFFMLNDTTPPHSLTYSESFVQPVPFSPEDLADIRPAPPTLQPEDGITTSRHFCKGWHCTNCGRLSSRFKWEHWECRNCGERAPVVGRIRTAPNLGTKYMLNASRDINTPLTQTYNFGNGFSHYTTFMLPASRGKIYVIFSAPLANVTADEILKKYQEEATSGQLKFRRWPLRSHKCRGTLLTNYFSQNTGEPYQYVGGTDNTVSWDVAPSAVKDALSLIKSRMEQALGMQGDFNEVLSAGYMEKQKMAFHSDAERGLGPTVASLSLGASAYMHFRLHAQYANELPEGCSREVLSLYLRHGDVVVMEGVDIQTYYEHTVIPQNFRIAATARFINNSAH